MPYYNIEAVDREGNVIKKVIEVENEIDIKDLLQRDGLFLVDYKPASDFIVKLKKINPFKRKKIKAVEIVELFENLHLMIKAGVPVSVAINDLSKEMQNKHLKFILEDIYKIITSGGSLYEGFSKYKNVFGDVILTLVKVGEETGGLEKVLKDAAVYLKRIEDIKAKTKQALIYPSFTFVAVLGSMIFWMVYVLPKMLEAFQNFNIDLPITTRILIWMSEFTRKYIVFIIIFIVLFFAVLKILRKNNREIKFHTDRILLKLPVIGIILTYFNYAFISEYMMLMVKAGVNLSRILEVLGNSLGNEVFKRGVINARGLIIGGESLSEAFRKQNLYSPMIIRMLNVGENTGQLEEQLSYISNYYYEKVDYISQNIAKMIEPLLISFVGIFMLIIILGLMGPIYNLISVVGKSQ
ncbi:type II secretion system F family protein [Sulfurihydrogenibium sp.]|jgi:type II secretory pathway component PulF|uniref:type II secretion system F family protein n=1 Tax=Sulfurihydrogenibium sp. TaxID=2053621 RepID=UPI0026121FEC|nr:type II secretion system F family protein [Sulfurihydrogenibium sp.]